MPDIDEQLFNIGMKGDRFVTPNLTYNMTNDPKQLLMPSHNDLVDMLRVPEGQAQVISILEHYGVINPLEQAKIRAIAESGTLQSMSYNSPEWRDRYNEILDRYTKNELLGMARSSEQQYTSLVAIDGDRDKEMIWLIEDDERMCSSCESRAGEIHTWAEWQILGTPGASVCQGGQNCRCDLIVVE